MKKSLAIASIFVVFFCCTYVLLIKGIMTGAAQTPDLQVLEFKDDDEEAKAYNVTRTAKTVEGLTFRVESDRPIEKVAGTYRPIDIDSYIAMKFNKLDKKLDAAVADLQKKIDDLTQTVNDLTGKPEVLSSQPNPAPPQNQTTSSP